MCTHANRYNNNNNGHSLVLFLQMTHNPFKKNGVNIDLVRPTDLKHSTCCKVMFEINIPWKVQDYSS